MASLRNLLSKNSYNFY